MNYLGVHLIDVLGFHVSNEGWVWEKHHGARVRAILRHHATLTGFRRANDDLRIRRR